jgi:haloalkane dehalogenase
MFAPLAGSRSFPLLFTEFARSLGLDVHNTLSDPREEVLIRYTKGTGRFDSAKKYIALNHTMYRMNGEVDGIHEGVWERVFEPRDFLRVPPMPTGPMDEPVGPVPHERVAAHTIARWEFNDEQRSAISVAGPAASHLIPLDDGSLLFTVSTAQIITGGTGRYEGAYGVVQSLGSTHVPRGVNLFGPESVPFPATTIDTFRLVRGLHKAQGPLPGPSPEQPQEPPPDVEKDVSPEFPYESREERVGGTQMRYVETGSGPATVLFVHGNPTWSYLWRNVLPEVAREARCVAVDLVGMGKSGRPSIGYTFVDHSRYLEEFIERRRLDDFVIVGHDWGSILALDYARRHPRRIKGIVLLEAMLKPYESWDDFPFPDPLRGMFKRFREPGGWDLFKEGDQTIDMLLPGPGTALRPLSARERAEYRRPFEEPENRLPVWKFTTQIPVGREPGDVDNAVREYGRYLRDSDVPKLLLVAEPGGITTRREVEWAEQNIRNLRTQSIGSGVHFVQEDHPRAIGRAIGRWVRDEIR